MSHKRGRRLDKVKPMEKTDVQQMIKTRYGALASSGGKKESC